MLWLTIMAPLAFPAQQASATEVVPLGRVATDPFSYVGRRIRTCGLFQDSYRPSEERILHDSRVIAGSREGFWLLIDPSSVELPPAGTRSCVTGTVRRRDGLSTEEAIARGIGTIMGEHTVQFPDYVLYPCKVEEWR